MYVQMLEDQMMAEGYDEIAIVDEHDNVIGHAPILSRHDADKMSNEDADNYIHKLADAAGLREEFEQMKEDMQVLMSLLSFNVDVAFDADAASALYNSRFIRIQAGCFAPCVNTLVEAEQTPLWT
jgi:hypothetical protein